MSSHAKHLAVSHSQRRIDAGSMGRVTQKIKADHIRNIARLRLPRYHVTVLLALHNGEKCLPDQLYSLKCQTHADWSLIVSDDDSNDGGPDLIKCFARAQPKNKITIIKGPNRGFAANFLHLIRRAEPKSPFVAFSDQDDVWLPEKLQQGLAELSQVPADQPAMYCGRTWICDPQLRKLRTSPDFQHSPDFSNAIVQNIGGGNTMIMNRAALRLVQIASHRLRTITSHDWWVYQIVSGAGGKVIFDNKPMVLYRQHDANVIGAGDTLAAVLRRLGMVLSGKFQKWNDTNTAALSASRRFLTPESRKILDAFNLARAATIFGRTRRVWRSGVHHQTRLGNAGLWLATVLNRI